MPELRSIAKLVFRPEYGEHNLDEAVERGYLSHVLVEIDGSRLYPVFFYRPGRLKLDLEASCRDGQPYIAETGMIVLPELTLEAMQDAVQKLCNEGYFNYMIPITHEQLANANPFHWPP